MLRRLLKIFEPGYTSPPGDGDSISHQVRMAAAALMIELTRADQVTDETEWQALKTLLVNTFHLAENDLTELLDEAHQSIDESHDLYQYTRLINDHYDYEEKCQLLEAMWRLAYADGRIDRYEEHMIRKVQGLIHVAHSDFIRVKQQSRVEMQEADRE